MDFNGLTSWVCFACGAQNAHGATTCTCGKVRSIECGACGGDVPFTMERCPACGMPRFGFEAAAEAQRQVQRIAHARLSARTMGVFVALLLIFGVVMLTLGAGLGARLAGAGLIALSVAGGCYAVVTERRARRQLM